MSTPSIITGKPTRSIGGEGGREVYLQSRLLKRTVLVARAQTALYLAAELLDITSGLLAALTRAGLRTRLLSLRLSSGRTTAWFRSGRAFEMPLGLGWSSAGRSGVLHHLFPVDNAAKMPFSLSSHIRYITNCTDFIDPSAPSRWVKIPPRPCAHRSRTRLLQDAQNGLKQGSNCSASLQNKGRPHAF